MEAYKLSCPDDEEYDMACLSDSVFVWYVMVVLLSGGVADQDVVGWSVILSQLRSRYAPGPELFGCIYCKMSAMIVHLIFALAPNLYTVLTL